MSAAQTSWEKFDAAAEAFERAAAAGTLDEERAQVAAILKYKEEVEIATACQRLTAYAGPPPGAERLPLRDEAGYDYGRVALRIPAKLFYGLYFDKRFGNDGLADPGVQKDIAKIHPYCRVTTVSGKTTVPVAWGSSRRSERAARVPRADQTRPAGQRPAARCRFMPGTMTFAN